MKECFQPAKFRSGFKSDTMAANHIMKGVRIWRSVSLENHQNELIMTGSGNCEEIGLLEIIKFGVFEKDLHVFSSDNFDEAAKTVLSKRSFLKLLMLSDSTIMPTFNEKGEEVKSESTVKQYRMGSDIKSYLIKEDWLTNSYTGKAEKYIIEIAPLVYDPKTEKTVPLFWLYYPEWKSLLSAFKARNFFTHEGITFEDVFTKRFFVSQVSAESNVFDRGIKKHLHGISIYLESELIKEKLNNAESDLFQH